MTHVEGRGGQFSALLPPDYPLAMNKSAAVKPSNRLEGKWSGNCQFYSFSIFIVSVWKVQLFEEEFE